MMKRRWSNNAGNFAFRILEESSAEVTSSSAGLVMSPSMALSPTSFSGSPEYGDIELWGYENFNPHNVISNGVDNVGIGGIAVGVSGGGVGVGGGCNPPQLTVLPSITGNLNHTPRSESANSISSGIIIITHFFSVLF